MSRKLWIASVFVGFFIAGARAIANDLVEGSDPRAKPMKEAVSALVEQVVAGDFGKAKAIYAGTGADLELLKAYVDGVAAAKAMRAAMDSKFGDNAATGLLAIDKQVAHMGVNDFNSVIFLDDPDRASSSADSPLGVGIEFKRVEGKWEVLSLASEPNTPQEHLARLRKYRSVVQAITEKIKSGGYQSARILRSKRHRLPSRSCGRRTLIRPPSHQSSRQVRRDSVEKGNQLQRLRAELRHSQRLSRVPATAAGMNSRLSATAQMNKWQLCFEHPNMVTGLSMHTFNFVNGSLAFARHDIRLESERLLLRPFTNDDMKAALPLYQDPEIKMAMEGNSDALIDLCYLERAWEYLARRGYLFAVVEKATGRVIGELCLEWMNLMRADVRDGERVMRMPLGIWDKTCWSRGYGKEMVAVATRCAFETLRIDRLCAMDIHPSNWRSRRLFESCGFRVVRELSDGSLDLEITRQAWPRD